MGADALVEFADFAADATGDVVALVVGDALGDIAGQVLVLGKKLLDAPFHGAELFLREPEGDDPAQAIDEHNEFDDPEFNHHGLSIPLCQQFSLLFRPGG